MTSKTTRYRRIFGEGVELDNHIAERLTLADWEAVAKWLDPTRRYTPGQMGPE